ncbi:serine/threonine protein kinase [Microbulbifer magnicolonia]|uniref:serine/threonine protein kinase n=1 Tax=Microbulbifer magnicolonia TaxID=3109744 RepID=UPI002B4090B6|nr:protein kinase [Microbulbifer sp. GG15]
MSYSSIRIPGYCIHGEVGDGGMASVYLATQESLNRKVAIKVLHNGVDARIGERFVNEAHFIASLNNPHVITIYDISTLENGDSYIAMEFVGGGDLIGNSDRFSEPSAMLGLIRQVALGLAEVHENGIIHRDVKPTNILFRKDGTAVLTDFGIAKDVDNDSDLTQAGSSLGSPSYSSPEQAQGLPLDVTTDIYSLGVVLLELILGQNPFKSDSHTSTAINHIHLPVPALPAGFDELSPLVQRMLAKRPEERYQSCRDLIADIDRILESVGEDAGPADGEVLPAAIAGWWSALPARFKAGLGGLATGAALVALYLGVFYQSETEREISRLLAQAEQSMEAGRYLAPAGDNARDFYRQVLLLDSTNLKAILGLKTAEERQLDAYLMKGAQALASDRLQRPRGDNALHYFRQALALDADNQRAHMGIAQVIEAYVRLAQADLLERDYRGANYHVDSGLSIAPAHETLLALRTELSLKLEQKLAQEQKQERSQEPTQQQERQEQLQEQDSPTVRTVIRNMLDKLRTTIIGDH